MYAPSKAVRPGDSKARGVVEFSTLHVTSHCYMSALHTFDNLDNQKGVVVNKDKRQAVELVKSVPPLLSQGETDVSGVGHGLLLLVM